MKQISGVGSVPSRSLKIVTLTFRIARLTVQTLAPWQVKTPTSTGKTPTFLKVDIFCNCLHDVRLGSL